LDSDKAKIQKAYHKKVLICHPDKFPGDEAKAALFQRVKKAYDLLSNDVEIAKFDAIQRGLLSRKRKIATEDVARQKMRENLEHKEKLHRDKTDERKKKAEEELARQESAQLIEQLMRAGHLKKESSTMQPNSAPAPTSEPSVDANTIVVRWKPVDNKEAELNDDDLRTIFKVYGTIQDVMLKSDDKKNRALIVFSSSLSAEKALSHPKSGWNFSISYPKSKRHKSASIPPSPVSNPVASHSTAAASPSTSIPSTFQSPMTRPPSRKSVFGVSPSVSPSPSAASHMSHDDYEKETLRRMLEFAKKQQS